MGHSTDQFYLVFFKTDNSTSVIKKNDICFSSENRDRDLEKGDIITVQWQRKKISGEILRVSSDESWLKKLEFDPATRKLSVRVDNTTKRKEEIVKNKKMCGKEQKKFEVNRKRTLKDYDQSLLEQKNNRTLKKNKTENVKKMETSTKRPRKIPVQPMNTQDSSKEVSPDREIQTPRSLEVPRQKSVEISEKEQGQPKNMVLQVLESLEVTPEVVTALERITTALKLQLALQKSDNSTEVPKTIGKNFNSMESWMIPSVNTERLMPQHDVFIDKLELGIIKKSLQDNPKEMLRKLLKVLVGPQRLANMCALGGSINNKALDAKLYAAVKGFVYKQTGVSPRELAPNRTVNLMCSALKNSKNQKQAGTAQTTSIGSGNNHKKTMIKDDSLKSPGHDAGKSGNSSILSTSGPFSITDKSPINHSFSNSQTSTPIKQPSKRDRGYLEDDAYLLRNRSATYSSTSSDENGGAKERKKKKIEKVSRDTSSTLLNVAIVEDNNCADTSQKNENKVAGSQDSVIGAKTAQPDLPAGGGLMAASKENVQYAHPQSPFPPQTYQHSAHQYEPSYFQQPWNYQNNQNPYHYYAPYFPNNDDKQNQNYDQSNGNSNNYYQM